ncbi:low molecular weight protein-tyrosine-phosphatase [Rhodohalobacter sulfatireducens]|uniref:protein-tyrosine-phosphatase n=1 Tax=Rhodohalobacter sulfatireducens TaxID=2911366 RepID=A0ABS9KFF9_9BACT|nr:low molecular weight protein-tyrosine-phosphatase [Rhodohalobacter sulfatireducens]MCG2589592.1 low molecular weight phosphotyrosine protein phosphatase [Rhodohalobacter sulfatireducens]
MNQKITKDNPYKICFVCLGNICRSPTAEGVFQHLVNERDLKSYFYIDSAGTSAYHIGEPANSKSQWVANQEGVKLHSKARRFEKADLEEFDLILAMDHENLKNIKYLNGNPVYSDKIKLLREFDPQPDDKAVPDPYYGGMQGFQNVFDVIKRSSEALLNELAEQIEDSGDT